MITKKTIIGALVAATLTLLGVNLDPSVGAAITEALTQLVTQ